MPCPRARRGEHRQAGFSLIEVLVALAIVGLALGAAAATLGIGLSGHEAARDTATAIAIAEEHLAEAGVTAALRPERRDGVFAGRFAWRLSIAPYDDPAAHKAAAAFDPRDALRLYRVAVTVAWRDGRRQRQVALSTLRLGRTPP